MPAPAGSTTGPGGPNGTGRKLVHSHRTEDIALRRQFQILKIELSIDSLPDFTELVLDDVKVQGSFDLGPNRVDP